MTGIRTNPRYPYTDACDVVRIWAGSNEDGSSRLSRSNARHLISNMASVMGVECRDLARKLADYYVRCQDEVDRELKEVILKLTYGRR